jgi:hypothetical protein
MEAQPLCERRDAQARTLPAQLLDDAPATLVGERSVDVRRPVGFSSHRRSKA